MAIVYVIESIERSSRSLRLLYQQQEFVYTKAE